MVNCIANDTTQEKFFALACEKNEVGSGCIPNYLKSRFYIDFSDPQDFELNYDRLAHFVYGREFHKKPPRGQIPERFKDTNSNLQPRAQRLSNKRPVSERANTSTQQTPVSDVLNLIYANAKNFKAQRGWLSGAAEIADPGAEPEAVVTEPEPSTVRLCSRVGLVVRNKKTCN